MSLKWVVFCLAVSNFFLSQFYRATNAVIAPQLLEELSLDTQGLGLLSASFFYGFALTQIPISVFLDRAGPRRLMTGLSILGIAGAFLFSWAEGLHMGLAGRFLLGVGMSCNLMGTLKLLTLWFDPLRFATLSGVVFSIGTMGNMAATAPFVFLVQEMGWRPGLRLIAGVNLLLLLLFYALVRDRPREVASSTSVPETSPGLRDALGDLRRLFRKKDYWIISFASFSSYGIFAALQTLWAGPFLMEVMGLSDVASGNLIFLMNLGVILGAPLWGTLSDRVFKTRKWVIFSGHGILSVVAVALAVLPPGTAIVGLCAFFLGFGLFRATGMLMYVQIKELVPIGMAGTAMTGINFFTMVGPAVFLQGLGGLMQSLYPHASRGPGAFSAAFLLCAACLASVAVLYLFTREERDGSQNVS